MQVIPATFRRKTNWPEVPDCNLMVSLRDPTSWPIQFLLPVNWDDDGSEVEAVSCGLGWARFMSGMEVGPEDVLVFEVVDRSTLVVSKYPRSPHPCFTKTVKASHNVDRKNAQMVSALVQLYLRFHWQDLVDWWFIILNFVLLFRGLLVTMIEVVVTS